MLLKLLFGFFAVLGLVAFLALILYLVLVVITRRKAAKLTHLALWKLIQDSPKTLDEVTRAANEMLGLSGIFRIPRWRMRQLLRHLDTHGYMYLIPRLRLGTSYVYCERLYWAKGNVGTVIDTPQLAALGARNTGKKLGVRIPCPHSGLVLWRPPQSILMQSPESRGQLFGLVASILHLTTELANYMTKCPSSVEHVWMSLWAVKEMLIEAGGTQIDHADSEPCLHDEFEVLEHNPISDQPA